MTSKTIQKYSKFSVQKLILKAQKNFNRYIRERDILHNDFFKCISCGQFKPKIQMNAGHFYSAGHYGALRFDEKNVSGQCIKCNNFLSGNLNEYRIRLIDKIGIDEVEKLDYLSKQPFKHDRFTVIEIIEKYK